MKIWSTVLVVALAFAGMNAEAARRLGGGGSFGKQSSNVTQRQATAPATASSSAQNSTSATNKAASPAAATPPAAPKKPWGAMLGGLAAGLGLAWLANSLGLGEAFGNILMFALLAMAALMLFGMFIRSKANNPTAAAKGFAYQGAGTGAKASDAVAAHQYSPNNVGNDASARPWESNNSHFDSGKSMIGSGISSSGAGASALSGSQTWGIPADFDTTGFLTAAKRNFVILQDAWDKSDMVTLRSMMTDEMVDEIKSQLANRGTTSNTEKTDVMMLDAQLLGIEEMASEYMASVEFSGMIREGGAVSPAPFREVWNMTKAKQGGGWLVAGVQALQ